jgi:hypothetical protein
VVSVSSHVTWGGLRRGLQRWHRWLPQLPCGWRCEFVFPLLVHGRDNNRPQVRMVSSVCQRGRQRRRFGSAVGFMAGGAGFFLPLVCLEDGRCSFNVQVLPCGVDWATNLVALVGVAEQLGRWLCWGSGGRMWQSGSPASSCARGVEGLIYISSFF